MFTRKQIGVGLVALAATIGISTVVWTRGHAYVNCKLASYDLHRETDFRLITGRCTAAGKDGGQVYVDQLRAFGSEQTSSPDDH